MGLITGVARDDNGDILAGATVHIYTVDTTTHPTIYSDRGLSVTTANPMTTGSGGEFACYAPEGIYDVKVTLAGHADVLIPDVPATDPTKYPLLAGRSGGQTLSGGTGSGENLTLSSTAHATKGKVIVGTMAFDEANNYLGIGTTSPVSEIEVKKSLNADLRVTVKNTDTSGTGAVARMRASANDASVLDLNAHGAGRTTTRYGITIGGWVEVIGTGSNGVLVGTGSDNKAIVFGNNDTERARIDVGGNFGIGTASPGFLLEVSKAQASTTETRVTNSNAGGAAVLRPASDTANTAFTAWGSTNAATLFGVTVGGYTGLYNTAGNGLLLGTNTNTPLVIGTNNTERARVSAQGNILVAGATDPTSAVGGLAFKNGTAPASSPADQTMLYEADAAAGDSNLYSRNEGGKVERLTGLRARVSAQFDKTSDTTLANITGLSLNVEAGAKYAFRAVLFTSSNSSGGVKAAIAGTATATGVTYEAMVYDAAAVKAQTRATALATAVGGVTAVTAALIVIEGLIVVNAAGTLTVQFAQNASNGTASSVLVNSYIKLIPVGA